MGKPKTGKADYHKYHNQDDCGKFLFDVVSFWEFLSGKTSCLYSVKASDVNTSRRTELLRFHTFGNNL
jgi:hypothetical protein